MARILLNNRASRITLVSNILLLPAEVKDDEQLGKVIKPSRTLISQRETLTDAEGKPISPYDRINRDGPSRKLLIAGVIAWSNERVDEPEPDPSQMPVENRAVIDLTPTLQGPPDPPPPVQPPQIPPKTDEQSAPPVGPRASASSRRNEGPDTPNDDKSKSAAKTEESSEGRASSSKKSEGPGASDESKSKSSSKGG